MSPVATGLRYSPKGLYLRSSIKIYAAVHMSREVLGIVPHFSLPPQSVPLMSQPVPFASSQFPSCLSPSHLLLMSQPVPFAPHILAHPICPKSVPLMSWPAHSQFPSCPSLLHLPDPLLHCQPVLYP